ncbi:MAG: MBL fold metallo-hydrolase [Paracoccaceae bacterium]
MIFEILLTSCLAWDPTDCGTGRIPVDGDLAACRERARTIAANVPSSAELQSFICTQADQVPEFGFSEIAPGVFVHQGQYAARPTPENRGDLANFGFIIGESSVAVIDTGMHPWIGRAILAAIRRETALPISAIILTGPRAGRVLGARPLLEDGGSVIGHAGLADTVAQATPQYLSDLWAAGLDDLTASDIVLPDSGVEGTRTISLGKRELVVTAIANGPTGQDLMVRDAQTGTLFLGDLLSHRRLPFIGADLIGWIEALERLSNEPAERIVPGHGPVALPWPGGSAPTQRYLTSVLEDAQVEIARGTPEAEAIQRIGANESGKWLFFNEIHPGNAARTLKALREE